MNWMLILVIVSVATGDKTLNVTTIPMETENYAPKGETS